MTDPDLPPHRDWSGSGGPDIFTLRAWLSVERASSEVRGLDTAVNFLQDRVHHIFGRDVFGRFSQFIEARNLDEAAVNGLVDDEPVLLELLAHLLSDDEAPDVPEVTFGWSAYEPGWGRRKWRKTLRRRRRTAELARVLPKRRRVAGTRARER